ncbi:uncharacterized protein FQA47_005387 [Oryzias melastigma]|uniref:DUF5581 domain-containing protein n=1 Tax=Oryzias melastigma TaxID=30732 RepID=A0A834FGE3_ORYME|nr:uncharacterized protein FQA47_005387 [Oryzias melastigma]
MTSSGFPVHAVTPPSREENVVADINSLSDLKYRIQELLQSTLDHSSITVMQEKLLLKQRSSYHFVIQTEEPRSTSDSINVIWCYLGPDRLWHVKSWIRTQIELLLAYLEMLFQEITISRQNLEAFVAKCEQVEVDTDEVASAEQKLQQIQQYIRDFEERMASNIEPLTLNSLFLCGRGPLFSLVQMSVLTLGPVMFNREKSLPSYNSICLFWYIVGEQSEESGCVFRVEVKSVAPQEKLLREAICFNYVYSVQNLKPNTCYKFTVKRMPKITLVYEPWIDTLHLKTLSSRQQNKGSKGCQ